MIALGLTVELLAAVLLVVGLLTTATGTALLWGSVVMVLLGLCVTALGVRRARPPRNAWTPSSSGAPAPVSDGAPSG